MATHSGNVAWRIPWTEEPGGLQSIGLKRVGHNWRDLAHTARWWITFNFKILLHRVTPWELCSRWNEGSTGPKGKVGGWLNWGGGLGMRRDEGSQHGGRSCWDQQLWIKMKRKTVEWDWGQCLGRGRKSTGEAVSGKARRILNKKQIHT